MWDTVKHGRHYSSKNIIAWIKIMLKDFTIVIYMKKTYLKGLT